jgi:hypothetical protein
MTGHLLILYEPEGTLNSNLAPYPGVPDFLYHIFVRENMSTLLQGRDRILLPEQLPDQSGRVLQWPDGRPLHRRTLYAQKAAMLPGGQVSEEKSWQIRK